MLPSMTPELSEALSSPAYWAAALVVVLLTATVVGLHFEALHQLNRRMPHWKLARHPRILMMIFCILALHISEIWLFGIGLYWADQVPGMGYIAGADSFQLLDSVYLSATTYSTLGYGDLVPHGPIRFVLGTEALLGLVLITWSASFAYLEMGRYWTNRG